MIFYSQKLRALTLNVRYTNFFFIKISIKIRTRSIAKSITFPFFRLSKKLCDIIYKICFDILFKNEIIISNSQHLRCRFDEYFIDRIINNNLNFFQFCQQAHKKTTAILYSNYIFYFNNILHEIWKIKINVTKYYFYCEKVRNYHPKNNLKNKDQYYDAKNFGLKHEILVSKTNFIFINNWLSVIDTKNKSFIRRIQLYFFTSQYIKIQGAKHLGFRFDKSSIINNDFFEQRLQMLIAKHNLKIFTISFKTSKPDEYNMNLKQIFIKLFSIHNIYSNYLKKILCNITRVERFLYDSIIKQFTCREIDDNSSNYLTKLHKNIREMKSSMKIEYETRVKKKVITT